MQSLRLAGPVFAGLPSPIDAIAREFDRGVSAKGLIILGIVVVSVLLLVSVLAHWYRTKEQSWRYSNPSELWRDLCGVHELTVTERRYLRDAARGAGLEPAVAIFLNPTALDTASQTAPDTERARELHAISRRLFES